eukprot:CAMPEP_0184077902 /NCGR_PEP_ID=MMETSP0974-20121125/898_1 /TAXON_ID=483370 /ORGANISM="non described non described, Strain CCMP2097" /LENGTH=619 /DNA_ID=CAMNT_0026380497 /DNA_START=18 /DNA_END=1876 /DNA_ORIENTATION=+
MRRGGVARGFAASHAGADDLGRCSVQSLEAVCRGARGSGCLSLADRGLAAIPQRVFELSDSLDAGEKFWECVELFKLDLAHNVLQDANGAWGRLGATLRVVRLSHNSLTSLPAALLDGTLARLEHLDAGDNKLQSIVFGAALEALTTLSLPRNDLCDLDKLGEACPRLEKLDVSGNSRLGRLPWLESLRLESLDAAGCGLNELPRLPQSLRRIDVARNALRELPRGLEELGLLVFLDLRENKLGPALRLRWPPALQQLFLSFNGLRSCDSDGGGSATILDLGSNSLDKIPEFVSLCATQLQSLDLSNNDLKELPPSLGYFPKLHRINLDGNPLRAIRRDVAGGGTECIKKFLRSRGAAPPGLDAAPSKATPADRLNKLANGVRDAESKGVLDFSGGGHAAWPLSVNDAETIAAALESDDGLDEYVADRNKRSAKTAVRVLDASSNALSDLPDCELLLALGGAVRELRSRREPLLRRNRPLPPRRRATFVAPLYQESNIVAREAAIAVRALAELTNLDVARNQLADLGFLFGLSALRTVNLTGNCLKALGEGWHLLGDVEVLDVSENHLSSLGDVHKAPRLAVLNVSNNDLRSVDADLGLSPALRALTLHGNPQRTIRAA